MLSRWHMIFSYLEFFDSLDAFWIQDGDNLLLKDG